MRLRPASRRGPKRYCSRRGWRPRRHRRSRHRLPKAGQQAQPGNSRSGSRARSHPGERTGTGRPVTVVSPEGATVPESEANGETGSALAAETGDIKLPAASPPIRADVASRDRSRRRRKMLTVSSAEHIPTTQHLFVVDRLLISEPSPPRVRPTDEGGAPCTFYSDPYKICPTRRNPASYPKSAFDQPAHAAVECAAGRISPRTHVAIWSSTVCPVVNEVAGSAAIDTTAALRPVPMMPVCLTP